ncbi:MAG: gamma-glutamyltransferase [Planctomycetes bacterium]|nr:gamma-glutamyltransferase [Planctomycetota bacterium]
MSKVARSESGMVVAAHPLAAEAGRDVLAEGGNAVDAAVAVSLAISVVEPFASGLGGGGYLLVAPQGDARRTVALDFRGVTPSIQTEEHFYPNGATLPWVPKIGPSSATIPGLGRALARALDLWGSGRSLARLAAPAVELAEGGFEVSETYAYVSGLFEGTLRCFPEAARIYLKDGRRYRPRERLIQKDLARALRRIAETGFEDLYVGEIGRSMTAAINATGPVWGEGDLARYEVKLRTPLWAEVASATIATMGPPSRGGAGLVSALRRLHSQGFARFGHNSARAVRALGSTFRELFLRLDAIVGDPDVFPVDLSLLDAAPAAAPAGGSPGTTHFTIVDREGTVATLSQTIGHFFGSGVVAPGWGILLNDDISDMSRRGGGRNSVGPWRRAVSNMAPTIVFRDGRPWLALGTPGSLRIFPALTQVIANILYFGFDLERAVAAGRVHWEDETLWLEGDLPPEIRAEVRASWPGNVVERRAQDLFFGGVHAVSIDAKRTVTGVADPRRDGVALGL